MQSPRQFVLMSNGALVGISCLVVGDGVEEVVVAGVEHGVDHAAGDSEHSGAAVLDLDVEGAVALLWILDLARVAAGDERRGAIIAAREVLGAAGVLAGRHSHDLGEAAEERDLGQPKGGNVGEGGKAHAVVQNGAERDVPGKVKRSGEGDAELLDHHADEGGHGNAAVLDLYGAAAGEALGVLHEAKRIEEVERTRVDAQAVGGTSITIEGSGGLPDLGGGEGGGGASEEGGDGELHGGNNGGCGSSE